MEKQDLETVLGNPTTTIPVAGRVLGLSRSLSYRSAQTGEIPTLTFGGKKVVPTAWLKRVLGMELA
jgi:hypothetical protein